MKFIKLFIPALFSLALISCEKQKIEDTWIVGTSADNPPYEFIKDGEVAGLDIDIIKAIAYKLDKKIVIKNLDFHGLLASLTSKNVDLVIAGLSVTPERLNAVDFTNTYTKATVALLYRTEDGFEQQEDLKDSKIGAQLGTIWAYVAQDLAEKFHFKVHSLSNNLMLVEELKTKAVDGVILEEEQAKKFMETNPLLSFMTLSDFSSEFAIALPKGSELKNDIDRIILELEEDGTLEAIRKKWLNQ